VVRIFKPDLPPLHKGMIPKTATSDPVAWGIVFLVDAFDGGFRRYVHKDDLLVVTHNNAWADYADAPESAKAWLPPNGAVHPQSHFSDKPVDWAPALLWWSTTRPLNDLGRAAVRDESLVWCAPPPLRARTETGRRRGVAAESDRGVAGHAPAEHVQPREVPVPRAARAVPRGGALRRLQGR